MKIQSITLQDYCGFKNATLELDRPLTVLFGVNGSGKSSVLRAVATVLSEIVSNFVEEDQKFWRENAGDAQVRRDANALTLSAQLSNGTDTHSIVSHHEKGKPDVPRDSSAALMRFFSTSPTVLVYYESARVVAEAKVGFAPIPVHDGFPELRPESALFDALAVGYLQFRSLFQWFKMREDVENELKVARGDLSLKDPQLEAVRRAVAGLMPGFSGLRIQRDPLHMVIKKGEQLLYLDQLSDGEKVMIALAADLARRLAMTFTEAPDPLAEEAIVLIDEIELHLHPTWQRSVLRNLQATFPHCQFIVTTHSPLVISEVENDAVVLVQDFHFQRPEAPTFGRDSNAVLSEAMGTPERPEEKLARIREISRLLDEERFSEARTLLDELAGAVTERDGEVVGLRTMLHFLGTPHDSHQEEG